VNDTAKYVWAAFAVAVVVHLAIVYATPRLLMDAAIERLSAGRYNSWRIAERVTPLSRTIVRPSPDFAYSACPYDVGDGPVVIRAAPWDAYWSLSLYAANSDNFFVLDDREARGGADIVVVRRGGTLPEDAGRVVTSPSRRGVALIRRLAPTLDSYNAAVRAARADICAGVANLAG
jgi:uncharacterized membrane protein